MTPDEQFFTEHPDRHAHIRLPEMQQHIDKQRAVRWLGECELQFLSLGAHPKRRRRILSWRVPRDNYYFEQASRAVTPAGKPCVIPLLVIPFLAFADEMIEDRDEVLLPIIHEIMMEAAGKLT